MGFSDHERSLGIATDDQLDWLIDQVPGFSDLERSLGIATFLRSILSAAAK